MDMSVYETTRPPVHVEYMRIEGQQSAAVRRRREMRSRQQPAFHGGSRRRDTRARGVAGAWRSARRDGTPPRPSRRGLEQAGTMGLRDPAQGLTNS